MIGGFHASQGVLNLGEDASVTFVAVVEATERVGDGGDAVVIVIRVSFRRAVVGHGGAAAPLIIREAEGVIGQRAVHAGEASVVVVGVGSEAGEINCLSAK